MKLTTDVGPETVSSVLVEAPAMRPEEWETCTELLGQTPPERTALLVVTLKARPTVCLDQWADYGTGERPANVAFVSRSDDAMDQSITDERRLPERCTVETVSNPGDLTELGTRILSVLDRWEGHDERTVLCFRGLSVLLQYKRVDATAQFVRAVADRVDRDDGLAHFHIDPEAHDTATLETFRGMLDERVCATDLDADAGTGIDVDH